MALKRRIGIVMHPFLHFGTSQFILRFIAENWALAGYEILGVKDTQAPPPEVDLAIFHVDLTILPQEYRDFAQHFSRVVNAKVLDISKRTFSKHLVERGDDYDGPVIVKTDANSGGIPEKNYLTAKGELSKQILEATPIEKRRYLKSYTIFNSMHEVPDYVWVNPFLVVQKFLPEIEPSGDYCVRAWLFFGNSEICYKSIADQPLVKSGKIKGRIFVDEVPEELRQLRARLEMDYGKYDFTIVDGEVVLLDVNKTPTLSHFAPDLHQTMMDKFRLVSHGIGKFFS